MPSAPQPPSLLLPPGITAKDLSQLALERPKEGLPVYVVVNHGENRSVESRVCQEEEDGAGRLFLKPLERSSIDIDPVLKIPETSPSFASTVADYEQRLAAYKGETDRPTLADLEALLQDISSAQPGFVMIELKEKPSFMMLREALTGLGRMTKISCNGKMLFNSRDSLPSTMQDKSIWIFSQFLEAFGQQETVTQNLMKLILQNSLSRIITRLAMMFNVTNFGYHISHALSNEVVVLASGKHTTESLNEYVKVEIKLRFALINIEEAAKANRFIHVMREIFIDPQDLANNTAGDGIITDTYSTFSGQI
jgi:hypothetical protein